MPRHFVTVRDSATLYSKHRLFREATVQHRQQEDNDEWRYSMLQPTSARNPGPWARALARWHIPGLQTGTRRLSGKWMKSSEPTDRPTAGAFSRICATGRAERSRTAWRMRLGPGLHEWPVRTRWSVASRYIRITHVCLNNADIASRCESDRRAGFRRSQALPTSGIALFSEMDMYLHFVTILGILSKNNQTFSNTVDIFRIISTFIGTRWTTEHSSLLRRL